MLLKIITLIGIFFILKSEGIYRTKVISDILKDIHELFTDDVKENIDFEKILHVRLCKKKLDEDLELGLQRLKQIKIPGIKEVVYKDFVSNLHRNGSQISEMFESANMSLYRPFSLFNNTSDEVEQTAITNAYLNTYRMLATLEMFQHFYYRNQLLNHTTTNIGKMISLVNSSKDRYHILLKRYQNKIKAKTNFLRWNQTNERYDKKGHTYEQVTGILQGSIQNEESLNDGESCRKSCTDYLIIQGRIRKPNGCEKRGCNGVLRDCQFLSKEFQICPDSRNSDRKYVFIREKNNLLGKGKLCPNNICGLRSWRSWFVHCDYCICLCDDVRHGNRHFSLKPVYSDVEANKVITGVQLINRNNIFQFKIEEARLENYAKVSEKQWFDPKEFKIIDKDVNPSQYHTITYENRRLDLDIVLLPPEFVATGIKFILNKGALKISVQGTKYDLKTGNLDTSQNKWFQENLATTKIPNENLDVPIEDRQINTTKFREINHLRNQYIDFTNTGIMQDVAQTLVPFIDTQPVSEENGPIQGVGLLHKKTEGYGGFISPVLVSFNNSYVVDLLLEN